MGRSTAVDAIIPESQDVATPQYRRTAHDSPSLFLPQRFYPPFSRTPRQNLAQLQPSAFFGVLRHFVAKKAKFGGFV